MSRWPSSAILDVPARSAFLLSDPPLPCSPRSNLDPSWHDVRDRCYERCAATIKAYVYVTCKLSFCKSVYCRNKTSSTRRASEASAPNVSDSLYYLSSRMGTRNITTAAHHSVGAGLGNSLELLMRFPMNITLRSDEGSSTTRAIHREYCESFCVEAIRVSQMTGQLPGFR